MPERENALLKPTQTKLDMLLLELDQTKCHYAHLLSFVKRAYLSPLVCRQLNMACQNGTWKEPLDRYLTIDYSIVSTVYAFIFVRLSRMASSNIHPIKHGLDEPKLMRYFMQLCQNMTNVFLLDAILS